MKDERDPRRVRSEDELRRARRARKRRDQRTGALLIVGAIVALIIALALKFVADAISADEPPPLTLEQVIAERDDARRQRDQARGQRDLYVWRFKRRGRALTRQRVLFRRALVTSPLGSHWLEVAFLCIYRHEHGRGGWATNTGNGYDGGLQMDASFQRAHGASFLRVFGPAYRWPRSVQIAVAIDAWRTRGFQPWPRTAKACGLR